MGSSRSKIVKLNVKTFETEEEIMGKERELFETISQPD